MGQLNQLSEDFLHQYRRHTNNQEADYNNEMYNQVCNSYVSSISAFLLIGKYLTLPITGALVTGGKGVFDRWSATTSILHPCSRERCQGPPCKRISQRGGYDRYELAIQVEEIQNSLTNNQRQVYNTLLEMVEQNNNTNYGNIIFLDAPGGTGKTYLITLILSKIRSQGMIVLATASSGIAATLLQGGRTFHSLQRAARHAQNGPANMPHHWKLKHRPNHP